MNEARDIVAGLIRSDRDMLHAALEAATAAAWRQACIDLITQTPDIESPAAIHTCFVEFGHRIRGKLDDDRLLVSLLRQVLPSASGLITGNGIELYRGENIDRYNDDRIGLCWTPKRDVAEMFGSGLNAMIGQGGLLLRAHAPAHALLAGPNAHSQWLGEEEYLLDPRMLQDVEVAARYPNLCVAAES